jgi:hypothetical protein
MLIYITGRVPVFNARKPKFFTHLDDLLDCDNRKKENKYFLHRIACLKGKQTGKT